MAQTLPIIDLSKSATEISNDLGHGMINDGFVYVKNHGIPETQIADLYNSFLQFYKRPESEKRLIHMDEGGLAWRGWVPLYDEFTSGIRDRKEGYYFGSECKNPHLPPRLMRGKNLWPQPDREGLQEKVMPYIEETRKVAEKLLEALGIFLGLGESYFSKLESVKF